MLAGIIIVFTLLCGLICSKISHSIKLDSSLLVGISVFFRFGGYLIGFVSSLYLCDFLDTKFQEETTVQIASYQIVEDGVKYIDEKGYVKSIVSDNIKIEETEEDEVSICITYGKITKSALNLVIYD